MAQETTTANRPVRSGRASRTVNQGELTVLAPLKPGGAERATGVNSTGSRREIHVEDATALHRIGNLHDMRVGFVNNDTQMLFATIYDGDLG